MKGMIQPDRAPFCSSGQIGVFWVGTALRRLADIRNTGFLEVLFGYRNACSGRLEVSRLARTALIVARHVTYIAKVIQHPSKVIEVQIKKEHTTKRAGQYIFVSRCLPVRADDRSTAQRSRISSITLSP